MEHQLLFYLLLLLVSFLYSSVGHGGASGYLALMALFGFVPEEMRPIALSLNVLVSATAFLQYYRAGHFRWNLFWPFVVLSVIAAFLGARISLDADIYRKVLGVLLLFPVVRFLFQANLTKAGNKPVNLKAGIASGGIIGFLSGLIGIGGGIILSPLILLFRWADVKQTAAVSALFILVNSLAGLLGLYSSSITFPGDIWLILVVAFIGGLTGSFLGSRQFKNKTLKFLLVSVLLIASVKLLFT